jgi:hypothetical protein
VTILAAAETIRWSEEDAQLAVKELIKMKKLRTVRHVLWKGKVEPCRTPPGG